MKSAVILSINNSPKHYNYTSLRKALHKRGVETKYMVLERLSFIDGRLSYNDSSVDRPDIIFFISQFTHRTDLPSLNVRKLLDLQNSTIKITNKITSTLIASDKWQTFKTLAENNIDTPITILIDSTTVYNGSIESRLGVPFVIKLIQGAAGVNYSLCFSEEELEREYNKLKKLYNHDKVIAQKYLSDTAGMIVTVGAVRERCKRAVIRLGDPLLDNPFLSDTKSNRTQLAYTIDKELEIITDKVMDVLDLDCARIDMMLCQGKYFVLEANPAGGFNIIDLMHNSSLSDDYVSTLI